MNKSNIRPSSDLHDNYGDIVKLVGQGDHVIITNNGVKEIVVISIDNLPELLAFQHKRYIKKALDEAKVEAADPDAKLFSFEEVMADLKEPR